MKEEEGMLGTLMRTTTAFLGSFWSKGAGLISKMLDEDEEEEFSGQKTFKSKDMEEASAEGGMEATAYREHTYNLQRVPYKNSQFCNEDSYWLLRSGMPFPSYHANPTRDMPARWVDIEGVKPPVEDLRAPRIRLAPQELERRGKMIDVIRIKAENDPRNAPVEILNLGYQDLGDSYQLSQLAAFLTVNRSVKKVCLTDNNLLSLIDVPLPSCKVLYLSRNQFITWDALPVMPSLQELYISYNFISNTNGLSLVKFPMLRKLVLEGNPLAEAPNYRSKVKKACPGLVWVDGERV
eukprot:TRINITY_DN56_c1_g1_i1.p1 TRINITY_DN56_c1_g1~~TRINITY_DN56_c1_g1_i1.p1  ORF type:complete len:294 (+),score=59.15 TRINITY_DN56_c1_g1_i1:144-1025(+)